MPVRAQLKDPFILAGYYIHIPYCRQACIYCNFHFSTGLASMPGMVEAMLMEMEQRQSYLDQDNNLSSIYLGGGTPSIMNSAHLQHLFDKIYSLHHVDPMAEITLEANPDDLSAEKLAELKDLGINRLSIGIQSFHDSDLQFLNRAHSSGQALQAIADAQAMGFHNITIDLIYGIPGQTDEQWLANLAQLQKLNIPHFSAYALTVEHRTALQKMIDKRQVLPAEDEQTARHFYLLHQWAAANGYEGYEISNFSRPGHRAVHNTAYWLGLSYIGIGPSAHSFDGGSRQWNIANNALYIKKVLAGEDYYEREELSASQRFNEYIMTNLRTSWGCSLDKVHSLFGKAFTDALLEGIAPFEKDNLLEVKDNSIILTLEGRLLSDHIISELFIID